MRIIIYTGKGGVGKTSIAAATAVRLAEQGFRTLVMSTDAAHSLSDSLDLLLGNEPVKVGERLWGLEVDSLRETEKHWGAIQKWLSGIIGWAKLNDVTTEEMLVFPFVRQLEDLQKMILDKTIASVRLVVNPEKMVVAEARRAFTYLNMFGFNTDVIIINRVLPTEAGTGYWTTWRDIYSKYEEEIRASFSPLPIFRIPMIESEVHGLPMLKRIGEAAFVNHDAAAVLFMGNVQEIKKQGESYSLELVIPFVQKDQLHLSQNGDDLTVQAGQFKRKVLLPRMVLGRPIVGARFADQKLIISFGEKSIPNEIRESEQNG